MPGEQLVLLALGAVAVATMWTMWSANLGRRAARSGRRWVRRLTVVVLVGLAVGLMMV